MIKKESELKAKKIENGTVIDHIPKGKSKEVYKSLKNIEENTIIVLINVPSKSMGKKDIIKIENKKLNTEELNQIALLCPDATIVKIEDYEIIEKDKIKLPETIKGIIKCKNPRCITNHETYIEPEFYVTKKNPVILKCTYCEHEITF